MSKSPLKWNLNCIKYCSNLKQDGKNQQNERYTLLHYIYVSLHKNKFIAGFDFAYTFSYNHNFVRSCFN